MAKTFVRSLLLPRSHSGPVSEKKTKGSDRLANECIYLKLVKGKKKVWSTRMEYQIRIQRIRFAYFDETNCHVLGRV